MPSSVLQLPVVVSAAVYDTSGFADEARNLILALDRAGVDLILQSLSPFGLHAALLGTEVKRLCELEARQLPGRYIHLIHSFHAPRRAQGYQHGAARTVARVMFETEGLPTGWAALCNRLDEIWVPGRLALEACIRSGVRREMVHVIPGPIPVVRYSSSVVPLLLPGARRFVFLSVFAWHLRKGWDLLLRAYFEEFRPDEDVTLALKVSGDPAGTYRSQLDTFVRRVLHRNPETGPHLLLLDRPIPGEDMPRLYRSADAYVMPSRGEGWGRPYVEAMAAGLPVIATGWGGHLEFMTEDNAYLIESVLTDVSEAAWSEVPLFRGQHWAEPSVPHLRSLMRRVFERRDEAVERGERGRAQVLQMCDPERAAALAIERLQCLMEAPPERILAPQSPPPPVKPGTPAVVWEGDQFIHHSLALVNREICLSLAQSDRLDLHLRCDDPPRACLSLEPRFAPLTPLANRAPARPVDVHIAHRWPPALRRPQARRWVLMQPWEYGSLPKAWIEPLNREVDEVWVPTHYVRDCYIRSGIDPARITVIPNGVAPDRFRPDAPPLALPTRKTFRFLFVGGTIHRKGADILLRTYRELFTAADDVCLVIKDVGVESFYRGQGLRDEILMLRFYANAPEVLYLQDDLPDSEMPGLYTACNCLVHPYRGEGFGLPIAEAMACGLPVVVPRHGACLDYCDDRTAYLIPAEEVRGRSDRVGDVQLVDLPRWAEIDRDRLREAMCRMVEEQERGKAIGRRASERVRRDFTWERAAELALERLQVLTGVAGPSPAARRRKLSVCMIVKNEEALLGHCLESVRAVADEIVVVDTGSTDRTVEIARSAGARVCHFAWNDDYAAARNVYLDHASGDWILEMDADETLDSGSHEELRRLVQTEGRTGYLVRLLCYTDRHGNASMIQQRRLRLFPNLPHIRYAGCIHVQAQSTDRHAPLPHALCGVTLHNDGYRSAARGGREKLEQWRGLLDRAIREEPADPFHAFNLGMTHNALRATAEAELYLHRSIQLCEQSETTVHNRTYLPIAHLTLANIHAGRRQFVEAFAACRAALRLNPDFADAHYAMGTIEAMRGNLDAALRSFRRAIQCRNIPTETSTDIATSGWKALLAIGQIHLSQGRPLDALEPLNRARSLAPSKLSIHVTLLRAYAALGQPDEVRTHAHRAAEMTGVPADLCLALARL